MGKLLDKTGPIKGVTGLAMNTTKNSGDSKMMMTFLNQSINKFDQKFDLESIEAEQAAKEDALLKQYNLQAGPVEMKKNCLSCAGVPASTMKMFKLACLSYKPSPV